MMRFLYLLLIFFALPIPCFADYYSSDYSTRMAELNLDYEMQKKKEQEEAYEGCFRRYESSSCVRLVPSPLLKHSYNEVKRAGDSAYAERVLTHGCVNLHFPDVCKAGMDYFASKHLDDPDSDYESIIRLLYDKTADPQRVLFYAKLACQYKNNESDATDLCMSYAEDKSACKSLTMDYCRYAEALNRAMTRPSH